MDCAGLVSNCLAPTEKRHVSGPRLTLWCGKVDDVAVALEHVDLLDGLDGLHVQLLQGLLELLVVAGRAGGSPLDLSPGGTLATRSLLDICTRPERIRIGHRVGGGSKAKQWKGALGGGGFVCTYPVRPQVRRQKHRGRGSGIAN